jgi:AraC-like DNA-binding protein
VGSYRNWSSDSVAEAEQFTHWHLALEEVFGPIMVEGNAGGPFPSRIVQTGIGPLTLSSVRAGRHRSRRTGSMAARQGDGIAYISIPRIGSVKGMQVSHEVAPRSGWLGMLSGSEPVTLAADAEFRQLVIGMPAELIVPRLAGPTGVAVTTGSLCGLVASTARHLFTRSADFSRADAGRASAHLIDLVVATFGSAQGVTPRQLILQSAMDEAERRLADRALSAAQLADGVHVSRRTLEKLFAEQGTTVARWLLERRLERSRVELLTTRAGAASVEVIAQRCGFADRTHFSRVFRARFGVAPSELRRATQSAGMP